MSLEVSSLLIILSSRGGLEFVFGWSSQVLWVLISESIVGHVIINLGNFFVVIFILNFSGGNISLEVVYLLDFLLEGIELASLFLASGLEFSSWDTDVHVWHTVDLSENLVGFLHDSDLGVRSSDLNIHGWGQIILNNNLGFLKICHNFGQVSVNVLVVLIEVYEFNSAGLCGE